VTPALILERPAAPLYREPNPRSELVSQCLGGETARVLEERGAWLRVERDPDRYQGWTHRGYGRLVDAATATAWSARAAFRSLGAVLQASAGMVAMPPLARLAELDEGWELPSGEPATLVQGRVLAAEALAREARRVPPMEWAASHFSGAPYLWGGLTPSGVDCSGLVQVTFAARGIHLPRDSKDQAGCGAPVPLDAAQPGDLLFFGPGPDSITHVAMAGPGETLVHATIACGGFVVESRLPGTRAAALGAELVAVRRISA